MKGTTDSVLPLLAALLVLASNLWRPETTFAVSLTALICLSLYYFFRQPRA